MPKRRKKPTPEDIRASYHRLQEYAYYLRQRNIPPAYIYRDLKLGQLYLQRR